MINKHNSARRTNSRSGQVTETKAVDGGERSEPRRGSSVEAKGCKGEIEHGVRRRRTYKKRLRQAACCFHRFNTRASRIPAHFN
jgi:hypothetical protein